MITAVASFATSFQDILKRQEIASDGNWHVLYKNVAKEDIDVITNHKNTKTSIISRDFGYSKLDGGANESKPYLFVKGFNNSGFENFPIKLIEGKLPTNSSEIVIPKHLETDGGVIYKIGDKITLNVGKRTSVVSEVISITNSDGEELEYNGEDDVFQIMDQYSPFNEKETFTPEKTLEYTVVGIIERPGFEYNWSPGYTLITYTDETILETGETANVSVILNKVNKKLYNQSKNIAESIGVERDYNNELLMYSGVTTNSTAFGALYMMMFILILIIMVGSISLIYNAFSISIAERSRHLGMLASVGATKKQKRNSVFFEGTVVGAISIPLGILAGTIGMGITFILVNPLFKTISNIDQDLRLVVSPISIIVAIVFSVLTIFISTYLPARRASKISPIDAIRQTNDIKLTNKNVKTSKLTRILFGFEAEIGLKNLKRNRRRYRATIFSLVISILLFLTVSTFTTYMKGAYSITEVKLNYDIAVMMYGNTGDISTKIKAIDGIDKILIQKGYFQNIKINKKYLANPDLAGTEEEINMYVDFLALSDTDLQNYAKEVGVDYNSLIDINDPQVIVINETNYQTKGGKFVLEEILDVSTKEEMPAIVVTYDNETGEEIFINHQFKFAAITNRIPMGSMVASNSNQIKFVVSEIVLRQIIANIYDELLDKNEFAIEEKYDRFEEGIFIITKDSMKLEEEINTVIKEAKSASFNASYYITNFERQRQEQDNMILLVSVFVYGFIVLITAICIANTFNTISTSISLRKREFAMLKSVGMTPKAFNKMMRYESIFYGMKALLYGLPLSFIVMFLLYKSMIQGFEMKFMVPWTSVGISVVGVFVIVGITMLYSTARLRKENIIDTLKQENI
jgi:putative ABC transport system permease protein